MTVLRALLPALALLALAVPSAHAAAPGLNLGTEAVTGDYPGIIEGDDVVAAAQAAPGLKSVRIFVDWAITEPVQGQLDGGRVAALEEAVAAARQHGITPVLAVFVTPGWANGGAGGTVPPTSDSTYASFVGRLAAELKGSAPHPVFEIWNEQDGSHFWANPDAGRYTRLLKAAYPAVKAADPQATVLFGALTGNNYEFLAQAYAAGAKGSFDGVAVHTDTACLVKGPDFYVRNVGTGLDGRINRFSFLGFREVRAEMERHGDAKPIWMTELGWATSTADCDAPGAEAGRKAGVTTTEAAEFLRKAYACLAREEYGYVAHALYFDTYDRGGIGWRGTYGLFDLNRQPKPALPRFQDAAAGRIGAEECGDFTPPAVSEMLPVKQFTGPLRIRAKAIDPSGVTRITLKVGGDVIRNFTGADVGSDKVIDMTWDGAKRLPAGEHTLRIEAIDQPSNLGVAEVVIRKLDAGALAQSDPTKIDRLAVKVRKAGRGRKAYLTGYVTKAGPLQLRGKVQAFWETRRPVKVGKGARRRTVMRWKKVHGGLKAVKISATGRRGRFTFVQPLKYKRYRVRVKYLGLSPYKPATSRYLTVRVR